MLMIICLVFFFEIDFYYLFTHQFISSQVWGQRCVMDWLKSRLGASKQSPGGIKAEYWTATRTPLAVAKLRALVKASQDAKTENVRLHWLACLRKCWRLLVCDCLIAIKPVLLLLLSVLNWTVFHWRELNWTELNVVVFRGVAGEARSAQESSSIVCSTLCLAHDRKSTDAWTDVLLLASLTVFVQG